MSILQLHAVGRAFGGVHAVESVSFAVAPGAVTGLIGPNGAGKTTLINLITGVLALSSGRIEFDGRDISREPAHSIARAGIARTFQSVRLLRDASVLDNVLLGMHCRRRAGVVSQLVATPAARREDEHLRAGALAVLERFGLASFAATPAGALSYGHQRRVEIARAVALEPKLLLLDEPVAGMNDVEASALGGLVRELAAGGLAVLLVEHNMRFVMSLCAQLHVLDSGRLIASGAPRAVAHAPAVIEAYLGAEPAPC